jgi:beta-glucosidase
VNIEQTLNQLTLEEKARLLSGSSFLATAEIPGKVSAILLTDGSTGLRKPAENAEFSKGASLAATCFPTGAALVNSWDTGLIAEVGAALGKEAQKENVAVVLGPAANIKRRPLCGRNFEYYSEDPYLSSRMAAGHIKGIQSQGVGACIKHFAVNNQETKRFTVNAEVDERTLREIYLASFEYAVKQGKPWAVMAAYNRLNGEHCCENPHLLKDVLRGEWGYDGVVVSDWGAVWDLAASVNASLDLQMPYCGNDYTDAVIEAVKNGQLAERTLDAAVRRILTLVKKAAENHKSGKGCDYEAHHLIARKAAAESAVLLKNEPVKDGQGALPLSESEAIAVIEGLAKNMRYRGGGSSHVNAYKAPTFIEALETLKPRVKFTFARGYRVKKDIIDEVYIAEALTNAKKADKIVYAMGLPSSRNSDC